MGVTRGILGFRSTSVRFKVFPAVLGGGLQTSCDTCGPNSVEERQLGAYTCTCLGENRVYQYGDKTCPCQSRLVTPLSRNRAKA